jgi:hypothetical protein
MKTRILTLAVTGILALPALLSAQQAQPRHDRMITRQDAMMNGADGYPMMGMGFALWMQPGPEFLLGQKDALNLSDEQVQRLEQLRNELSEARANHIDRVRSLRQRVGEALSGEHPDLDQYQSALQSLADEYVAMQVEIARSSQNALAVLNDTQRSYVRFAVQMMHQMGDDMWLYGQMMQGGMMQGGMGRWRGTGGS